MDKTFWEDKWQAEKQGWDMGEVSPPIKNYVDKIENKAIKVLIPGAGNAYEAEYMHQRGFKNVHIIDITEAAVENFKRRCPDFPESNIIRGDFFALDDSFDLIIEQTFFCAIDPKMRSAYCTKMHELLSREGALVGLLFDFPLDSGPPFGGSVGEYESLFRSRFSQVSIKREEHSIAPRLGREVWIDIQH